MRTQCRDAVMPGPVLGYSGPPRLDIIPHLQIWMQLKWIIATLLLLPIFTCVASLLWGRTRMSEINFTSRNEG